MSLLYNIHCYCLNTFSVDGVNEYVRGRIYKVDRMYSGVCIIDLDQDEESFGCFYDVMDLDGDSIGYLASEDFDDNFEEVEMYIEHIDEFFNKIMDGNIS